ncbi:MAG: (2Fe-2S)-binding protein [Rhodovibrionaceae bacterium]
MPLHPKNRPVAVELQLNGKPQRGAAAPNMLLSDFLRQELGATGTHVGCEHGICGACTVRLDGRAVRSCLCLAVQAEGRRVETIEGLAEADGSFGILQDAFHRHFALQCGFCTPGFLMSLADYLEGNPDPTEEELREALSGNICRCTGYAEIVKAALYAAARLRGDADSSRAK